VNAELLRGFLDRLEELEARLLVWGVVDAGFSRDELLDHAMALLTERGLDESPEALIDEMSDRRLLFQFRDGLEPTYRTRSAETVRLMAKLRQMFPGRPWAGAPTLVADFRYDLRPREYPSRHIRPDEALTAISAALPNGLSATARRAIEMILGGPGRDQPVVLSDFQLTATSRLLSNLLESSRGSRGLVVAAGTGTGKTLAFYLPALAHLSTLVRRGEHWTKALAIYPRNELLKDQLSETYAECRRLDSILLASRARKISVGAFFGPTPRRASTEDLDRRWSGDANGYTCPFLSCPDCGGRLVWTRQSVQAGVERLDCSDSGCGRRIDDDEIVLTRERMAKTPPDVLFTTTEMLNRQLSDSRTGHIFGPGASRTPQIVLLDEIHTYTGVHGAQVAHLMRRWRYALGPNARVQFVGLSATLRNASDFFAQLTGITPSAVEEVPLGDRVDRTGKEYHLILRGDPVSATSLLSTTIQAGMLLRRILDPVPPRAGPNVGAPGEVLFGPSGGMYGRRVYAFTDDLDVTNRLYHNLLDAEGRDDRRRAIPGQDPLASLRSSRQPDTAQRARLGQFWRMCELIGFDLYARLSIGRTSSQDVGVDRFADITVATASLEVGYNDPGVGAILQHKAPRSVASFLQRRGRAGRLRGMRPWTVVVLSDYGRDRAAYQGYDQLFDPVLDARALPIANRYVLRMQAVYVLMDWLRTQLPRELRGAVWGDLGGPVVGHAGDERRRRQQHIASLLERLLAPDPTLRDDFGRYLRRALQLPESLTDSLLWERPRAVLTSAVPTALRRLASGWRRVPVTVGESDQDTTEFDHPLPDFIPAQLFGDLNLPEVIVLTQTQHGAGDAEEHAMPVVQAIRTLTPGRVTRRFAIRRARHSHWVAPPALQGRNQVMPITALCAEWEELGPVQVRGSPGSVLHMPCFRPWSVRATLIPPNVSPTSNGSPIWATQIYVEDDGLSQEPPATSEWSRLIPDVRFFVHRHGSRVSVRRFSTGANASIRLRDGSQETIDLTYASTEMAPGAVGFFQESDGILFRFRPPIGLASRLATDPSLVRASRTAYYRHRVLSDPELSTSTNFFQRDWLAQIYLSALIAAAALNSSVLATENSRLRRAAATDMAMVMETIFQTLPTDAVHDAGDDDSAIRDEGDEDAVPDGDDSLPSPADSQARLPRQRVHDELLHLCGDPSIVDRLASAASVLWEPPADEFERWLAQRFKATLGEALLAACQSLSPHFAEDDLYLDLDGGPRPPGALSPSEELEEIWITESTPGGGGVVEEVLHRYADDPRAYFRLVESALGPGDLEVVDEELTRIVMLAGGGDSIARQDPAAHEAVTTAFAEAREATGNEAVYRANRHLLTSLARHGILVTHPVAAAMRARVLRPGSSRQTDELVARMLHRWNETEAQLGIEIDSRVFAHLASRDPTLVSLLERSVGTRSNDSTWAFNTFYSLIWSRGYPVRSQSLRSYNPFADAPETDRRMVLSVVRPASAVIDLRAPDWRSRVAEALARDGAARLAIPLSARSELKAALLSLAEHPLEVGFLSLFPQVAGIDRGNNVLTAMMHLREATQ
jgi:hypothetical protein